MLSNKQVREPILLLFTKAVLDLFPKAMLFKGGVSDYGFFYDIDFGNQRIDANALRQIEERMSLLIFEGIEFKRIEMLRDNAVSLLRHNRQKYKADLMADEFSQGVMAFLQLGACLEPSYENFDVVTSELKHFKLMNSEEISFHRPRFPQKRLIRVNGTAFLGARDLKKFLKSSSRVGVSSHLKFAEEMELCVFKGHDHCWLPRGDRLLSQLAEGLQTVRMNAFSEEQLVESAIKFLSPVQSKPSVFSEVAHLYRELEDWQQVGMWRSNCYYADRSFLFVSKEQLVQEIISSLQFIVEKGSIFSSECCWIVSDLRRVTPKHRETRAEYCKILVEALDSCGYKYTLEESSSLELIGPRAYLTYADAVGKKWKGPFVGLEPSKMADTAIISRSIYGSFERYVAYLLENDREKLSQFI